MNHHIRDYLIKQLSLHQTAYSYRYPHIRTIIKYYHIMRRYISMFFTTYTSTQQQNHIPYVIIRHQSPLIRTLGNSDPTLQYNKIINLNIACEKINGIIIKPGEYFSIWYLLGKPSYAKGYKDGMILLGGKVVQGVGGGLCQLANLLYRMFIHSDLTIIERYHHGLDIFPDSHRVLPFGSGATLVYNYRDLIVRNDTQYTYQIIVSIGEVYLKGQLRCSHSLPYRYHVVEKDHCFITTSVGWWRYNQLRKQMISQGIIKNQELICTNCSPVLYDTNKDILNSYGYTIYHI